MLMSANTHRLNVDITPDQARALQMARIVDGKPASQRIREWLDAWIRSPDNLLTKVSSSE
jgi:hypothetical protein